MEVLLFIILVAFLALILVVVTSMSFPFAIFILFFIVLLNGISSRLKNRRRP